MDFLSRAVRAYRRGGLSEVTGRGIELALRPVEKRTVQQTRWAYPYYEWKHLNKSKRAMNKLSKKGLGPRIVDFPLQKYKSSNTLFVLGSGSSINEISDKKWKHIEKHDSIGLNRWPIHDHIPTYHVFEMKIQTGYEKYNKQYKNLLEARRKQYSDLPIILKNSTSVKNSLNQAHLPDWLLGDLIISSDSGFDELVDFDSSTEDNEYLLRYLLGRGYFDQGNLEMLYRKRGSISYLLHLASVLGYKKVVLCGVDMIDSEYFFEERVDYYEQKKRPIPKHESDQKSGKHETNDEKFGQLTLDKVILSMKNTVFNLKGMDLYVENDISALHPDLPLYSL
jgi:hypothetical protein